MITWHDQWARPWESPWGVCHTLAWYNKVTLREAIAALVGRPVTTEEVRSAVAPRGGHWWTSIASTARTPQGRGVMAALQARLGAESPTARWCRAVEPMLEPTPRICLRCIGRGYHSVIHQLAGLARCPLDGTVLSSRCPACGATFGDPKRVATPGFACAHCGHLLVDDESLHLPGDGRRTKRLPSLDEVARWVERGARTLAVDEEWPGLTLYAPTRKGPVEVSRAAALLPMLAQMDPYPGNVLHLGPQIAQLTFAARKTPRGDRSGIGLDKTIRTINAVVAAIFSQLGEHGRCFHEGRPSFRINGFDRDHVRWNEEFCVRAYAYLIWKRRIDEHIRWAPKLAAIDRFRWYPSEDDLSKALHSSFYYTLHGLAAQQEYVRRGFDIKDWDVLYIPWLPWVGHFTSGWDASSDTPSSVLSLSFERPADFTELSCDRGAMVQRFSDLMHAFFRSRHGPSTPDTAAATNDDDARQRSSVG